MTGIRRSPRSVFTLLLAALFFTAGSLFARDLYWTEYGGAVGTAVIKASDIDGANESVFFEGVSMDSFIVDIAVTDTHLYWSGHTGGDVWRANRDGSSAGRIIEPFTGLVSVHNIAVDDAGGKIYIACHTNGIFSANLDGTNLTSIFSVANQNYSGITLKGSSELLWFTTLDNFLYVQDTDGFWYKETRSLEGGDATYGLAYDPAADMAYYTVWAGAGAAGALYSYSLTTSESTLLRSDIMAPLGLKLSPARTHLLIAQRGLGLGAYRISDGGYELIVPATGAHFGVAVTAEPELIDPSFPPPPAQDGDVIFFADFEEEPVGASPRIVAEGGVWTSFSTPTNGSATVEQDAEDNFGFGIGNRYLRVESANDLNFQTNFVGVAVLTLSFDLIGRFYEGVDGLRHVNVNLRTGASNNDRVHLNQFNSSTGIFDTVPYEINVPLRFETVVNNSTEAVSYVRPDGATATLGAGLADLWVYDHTAQLWDLMRGGYTNVRHASVELGDLIMNLWFQSDSNAILRSYDLDNVKVTMGAHLSELEGGLVPIPYPEVPVLVVHEDFNQYPEPFEMTDVSQYLGPFTMNRLKTSGNVHIVRDTENWFGRGTDNLVMRWDSVLGTQLDIPVGGLATGVATVAFDMYHEGIRTPDVTHRLGARFHVGSLANSGISQNFGFQANVPGEYFVRGLTATTRRIYPHYIQRWVSVVNNTRDTITYDTPRGAMELSPARMHVWLNGYLFNEEFAFGATQTEKVLDGFRFDAFNTWSAYIDNIRVWEGAIVPEADFPGRDVEPAPRDLLVYEGFDYPEGTLIGLDGGIGWGEAYSQFGTTDSAVVAAPGLSFPLLEVAGNRLLTTGTTRNFRVIDIDDIHSDLLNPYTLNHIGRPGTSIWVSALFQAVTPVEEQWMGFGFYRDTNEQSSETIFIGKGTGDDEATRGWRVQGALGGSDVGAGLGVNGESGSATLNTMAAYGDLSLFVLRIDYGEGANDRIYVFHNPDPSGPPPSNEDALGYIETPVGSFGFDRIRVAGNENGFYLDELRVGATWEAVTPLGDEPPLSEGYTAWQGENFPGETSPAIIGIRADPDGDGIKNLIEYALGLDPTTASVAGLPTTGTMEMGGVEYLTLTFTKPDSVDDISYQVQVAGLLGGWGPGAVLETTIPNGNGTTTYIYRDSEPLDGNNRRFMRLSVALVP